jgi:hypothetical protein
MDDRLALTRLFRPCPFHWARLRDNSCALQRRGFCFPGSSRTAQVPPVKHPLALEAEAARFCVPQENGERERRTIHVLFYVKWNSFGVVCRSTFRH